MFPLLDEATSMIDMETERHIQDAFKRLSQDRTMFIVAHRLSTIMNADLIVVIKAGCIIEKGSHEELINAKGTYHQLWSKQLKPDEIKPNPASVKPLLIDDLFDSMEEESGRSSITKDAVSITESSTAGYRAPAFTGTSFVHQAHVDIPRISSRQANYISRPIAQRPAVTFSLPETTVWSPQFQYYPVLNPRMTIPNHGILKNGYAYQGPVEVERRPEPLHSRPGSGSGTVPCRLKPWFGIVIRGLRTG